MAFLITTTNFIGRSLADHLASQGDDVILFGDNVEPRKLGPLVSRIAVEQGDPANFNEVLDIVKKTKPEGIFHLGQLFAKDSENDPWRAFRTNTQGTQHILEAARLFDVPKVVYFSTHGTFGDHRGVVLSSDSPQQPPNMYGASKLMGELLGRVYYHQWGLDFRCLRFPPLFGPGADVDTFSSPLNRIIHEPALGRPYAVPLSPDGQIRGIYLKDATRAFLELFLAPPSSVKTRFYTLAGVTASVERLIDTVRLSIPSATFSFDRTRPARPTGSGTYEVDESHAAEEWGWKPRFSFDDAVADFIRDVQSDRRRYE